MDKLAESGKFVIGVGKLCEAQRLDKEDLPDNLRTILKSLHGYVPPMQFRIRILT